MNALRNSESIVIETVTRVMVPFIQIFALYVIVHGTGGPGGGFQGGVIFGASYILYAISFGLARSRQRMGEFATTFLSSAGLYIYGGVGLLAIIFSRGIAQYLNYSFVPFTLHHVENRAIGMDAVEFGIGITVSAITISIFFDLISTDKEGEERQYTDGNDDL